MSKFVLTAELQLQAPKNVRQIVNQIQSQLNNININANIQNAGQATGNLNNITKAAQKASDAGEKMGKSFRASIRRFSALAIATRAVSLFTNGLGGAIKEAIDFERELVKISQVTGKSISQLSSLTNTISRLSTGLGVSSTSLLSVSRILAQTGLSARDTQIALSALAKTELAPTFDNIQQTAEGAVAILNQFGQGARSLEAQLGSLNAVAGQFAVESGDLIATIRRTGGVFKSAGGDLNQLIALFTSVRSTTRESAESIATGLRTIFTRIQRPETIEYLRQFGVELEDLDGKFVGPYQAIEQLSKALGGLGERDLTFVQIAEQLGGFRQIGKVLPLLQQFSVAQDALNVAQQGSGSLADDAATAQAALAVQITKVKEEFFELIRGITATTSFQMMADTVLSLASAMISLAEAVKPILPLLAAFAAIKIVKGAGGFLGGLTGGAMGFNSGGSVPGSGSGDTVPAMLTPGEFVIRKSAVQAFGADNLSSINKYGKGGRIAKIKATDAYDGDSWHVEHLPEANSPVKGTSRANGYDAYELRSGQQWEKALGRKARDMAQAGFTDSREMSDQHSLFKSLTQEESVGGRPVHDVPNSLITNMVNAGVAIRTQKGGEKATGGIRSEQVKQAQIRTLTAMGDMRLVNSRKASKFAMGGSVSGSDTVPAMLTPGEFVVNEKSAKSYGYGNLKKINGYAQGGVVKNGVQHFANGGGPVMAGSSSLGGGVVGVALDDLATSASDLKEQMDANTSATEESTNGQMASFMALGTMATGLAALTPKIDETSGFFDYLAAELTGFGMKLVAVAGIIQSFGGLTNIIATTKAVFQGLAIAIASMRAASIANAVVTGVNTTVTGVNTAATGLNTTTKGAETLASIALVAAKVAELLATPAGIFVAVAVAAAALATALYLGASASAKFHKAQMEMAIEDGDIEKAGKEASQATVQMGVFSPDKSLIATARAQAAATKSTMELEKATKNSATAMKRFEKGAGNIADVFQANNSAVKAAAVARAEADLAVAENSKKLATGFDATLRAIGAWLTFGFIDTAQDVNSKVEKENKSLNKEADDARKGALNANMPALNVLQKQVAAAGGSFDDFMDRLEAIDEDLYNQLLEDGFNDIAKNFKNVANEAARTRAAFKAMNLGFRGVQGAAGAAALGARTITGGLQGDVPLENVIDVLETGITNAAQGMSFDTFNNALGYAAEQLMVAGASAASVEGFGEMFQAIFVAQKQFASATDDAKNAMMADFLRGTGGLGKIGDQRDALADAIVGNLPGVSEEIKGRIGDVIRASEIDKDDLEMLAAGNPAALDKVMGELGEKIGKQVLPALENLKAVQEQQSAVAQKLVDSQMKLLQAQERQIDVTIKANKWIEKFGGQEFTPAMERQAILDKANLPNNGRKDIGSSGGTANEIVGDFKTRRAQVAQERARQTAIRNSAASGDARAQATVNSPAFKKRDAEINSITNNEVKTHEALLKTIDAEIKAIEAKTAAEKKAADALLSGSYEDFVDQMAGIGATAAARLGDQSIMSQFGRKDFGRGVDNLEAQKKAGVTTINGQDIDRVISNTASAGFQAAGMNSRDANSMAERAYQTSPEVEGLKEAGRIIAEDMKRSSQLQVDASQANTQVLEAAFTRMTKLVEGAAAKLDRVMNGRSMPSSKRPASGGNQSSSVANSGRSNSTKRGGSSGAAGGGESAGALDMKAMSNVFETFNNRLSSSIDRLEALQIHITIPPVELNINFNGGGILQSIRRYVGEEMLIAVKKTISTFRVGPNGTLVPGNGGQLPLANAK